ncbi:hemicentin-1-like [Mizuhopecten yessoensis]|uniref:hemicentin-1-like n=1 Tax=Mizuhopecten yessoensis TaxID=6573 RepID=UPI000B45A93A|nr:hemicentin-1-like [Mizuhopecten yessoensis]
MCGCEIMANIYLQKHNVFVSHSEHKFHLLILLLTIVSTTDAVTLTGSSEYAVPGSDFTLTCDVPEESNAVTFYRRPDASTPVGSVQVGGSQCYNTNASPAVPCTPDVCSCVITSTGGRGTVFRWVTQPQTGDHGSVWFCKRTNLKLIDQILDSPDFTLNVADGPRTSLALSPSDTTYTRTEGGTLPDITCTAECRPDCTFVWTKPDNTNFTASAVLSLGQLDRSEHGTYICTAGNVVGTSSITTSVNVQYGPGTSTGLSPSDTTYTRNEGDTLPDITCTADCRPGCTFAWTKPDNTKFTASAVLSLGQLDRSEHGTYRCTSWNVVGTSISTASVIVQYGPGRSIISTPGTFYNRTEGETVQDITCTAACRPGCTFVWTKPDNTNFTASAVLSLGQLDRSEHGTYICKAWNVVGTSNTTVSILLHYGPGDSITFQPEPDVLESIENQTIPEILCSADCRPSCTYIWSKAGRGYPNPLSLSVGTTDNAGQYTCTADNIVSKGTKTWNLLVRSYTRGNTNDKFGCTVGEERSCCTDTMYVTGVVLTCTGVITLLLTVGLGIFISQNGRLPFIQGQHIKQRKFQTVQFSEQAVAPNEEDQRSSYEQLDMNAIAKPSVYSEIENQGRQKDPINEKEYESLECRSNPNVYDELSSTPAGSKGIYINTDTAIAGSSAGFEK